MPERVERLVTGITQFDDYIEYLCSQLDRALNVTAAPPLQAMRSAKGLHLAAASSFLALARSQVGGVPAATDEDTPGVGDVDLLDIGEDGLTEQGITEKVQNLSTDAVGDEKNLVIGRIGKYWIVLWELCD